MKKLMAKLVWMARLQEQIRLLNADNNTQEEWQGWDAWVNIDK